MFYHDVQRVRPAAEYDRSIVAVTGALLALGPTKSMLILGEDGLSSRGPQVSSARRY